MKQPLDNIMLVGIDHKTAPTQTILDLKKHEEQAAQRLWEKLRPDALVILATCNRFEAYIETARSSSEKVFRIAREEPPFNAFPRINQLSGTDAVRHLFRVTSGLESAILGDHEVLGQTRKAMKKYTGKSMLPHNSLLHNVFVKAVHVGARVRRETGIGEGRIGYPQIALEQIISATRPPRRIVILGWGKASQSFLKTACSEVDEADEIVVVTRRTPPAGLPSPCSSVENKVVFTRPEERLTWVNPGERSLGALIASQRMRHLYTLLDKAEVIVDLTTYVPRAPHGRRVYGMKFLEERAQSSIKEKRKRVPHATRIIEEELEAFQRWVRRREADIAISALMKYARQLGVQAAARASRLPPDHLRNGALVPIFDSFARKLLHPVFEALRETARGSDPLEFLAQRLGEEAGRK